MDIVGQNIKTLCAGGTLLTKKMDNKLELSKIIRDLNIKQKGLSLEKIAKSLISTGIDDPKSVLQSVKHIRENSTAQMEFEIDPLKIREKTYYRGLEYLGKNDQKIFQKLMDNVTDKYKVDLSLVFSDWTSSFFTGKKCGLAKRGFSKDHRPDKEQIKIGIAVGDKKCIGFHYSVEEGNVADVKHFQKDFEKYKSRLPKGALIVIDKGAISNDNFKMIREEKCHNLTASKNYESLRKAIRSVDKSKMKKIKVDKKGKKTLAIKEKVGNTYRYIYYDDKRAENDVAQRAKAINKVLDEKKKLAEIYEKKGAKALRKKLTQKKSNRKELNGVIVTQNVTIQKRLVERSDEEIKADYEKDKDLDGFFALESSKNLEPLHALETYRRKDVVEKMISDLKSTLKMRPFRVWNDDEVKGAVLISMIIALFIGLAKDDAGFGNKTRKTIISWLKNLTLVVILDKVGNVMSRCYANATNTLVKLVDLPSG